MKSPIAAPGRKEFAPSVLRAIEPMQGRPLHALRSPDMQWEVLQLGTQELLKYCMATLRRTW
jgi:hypothetical protein